MGPPPQPPQPPHGKRECRFIVAAMLVVLVLILALGGVFAAQMLGRPAPHPNPTPVATTIPAPTAAVTPTTAPTKPTPVPAAPTPAPTAAATPTPAPPAGIYQPINALWMKDATTGWASTTTNRILRTTDGGKSWQDVTPPYPTGLMREWPPAFASLSGTVAWVAVSEKQQPDATIPTVLFRTSDGGLNWQEVTLPRSGLGVSQVQFVNALDGWVLAGFGGGTAGSQGVDLFRSTDGGRTWSTVARAPGAIPFSGEKSMSWVSATTGWITGSSPDMTRAFLFRTQDGARPGRRNLCLYPPFPLTRQMQPRRQCFLMLPMGCCRSNSPSPRV